MLQWYFRKSIHDHKSLLNFFWVFFFFLSCRNKKLSFGTFPAVFTKMVIESKRQVSCISLFHLVSISYWTFLCNQPHQADDGQTQTFTQRKYQFQLLTKQFFFSFHHLFYFLWLVYWLQGNARGSFTWYSIKQHKAPKLSLLF